MSQLLRIVGIADVYTYNMHRLGVPEQLQGGIPLDFGIVTVVDYKPSESSCTQPKLYSVNLY